jgi:chemotaxis protein methyltransferase CheR
MKDQSCICFLQWALPLLHMRWPGFRKVRGQVCKRLERRLDELHLEDLKGYRSHLENNPLEWYILDSMCRITISRFYRDRGVYNSIRTHVLPELLGNVRQEGDRNLSCWCIGAASGEEPYSLSLLWELSGLKKRGADLKILATEVEGQMLNRARNGCYPASSLRELDASITNRAFTRKDGLFCLKEPYRKRVEFLQQDIRNTLPEATFHLILCRNLVFTYFSRKLQEEISREILLHLKPGGGLVIGIHEELPSSLPGLAPWLPEEKIYRRTD